MAISTIFTTELQAVDNRRSFTEVIDSSYDTNDYSVAGWELRAGSEAALEHAASAALHKMGFRWYTPVHTHRPNSVPSGGVTIAKRQNDFPYIRIYPSYGFGVLDEGDLISNWLTLNNCEDTRRPAGHVWGTIYNAINASGDTFFTDNPTYWTTVGAPGFNLELTGSDRTALVNRVAQYVYENLNDEKRHSMDPNDGDGRTTDDICDFISEVVARVHELDGSTEAKLGLYAYAGHRTIPTNNHPHIYVQIALGFNDLGIGYPAMVQGWGEKVYEVALRGYGAIPAWASYRLGGFNTLPETSYESYLSHGANGINMESNYNWLHHAVLVHHSIRFWKDHTDADYASVRDEIVANVFQNDSAVRDWYDYWYKATTSDAYEFKSFSIVDRMKAPHKAQFQQLLTWNTKLHEYFRFERSEGKTPKTFSILEQCLRWGQSLGAQGIISEYGFERQLANANVAGHGRPDLRFSADAHWKRYSVTSTNDDYEAARESLRPFGERPSFIEWETLSDLVVVDVTPEGTAANYPEDRDAKSIYFQRTNLIFEGPGTVTRTKRSGDVVDTITYGPGLHQFASGSTVVSWDTGTLYADGYPTCRVDGGNIYIYFPRVLQGRYVLGSGSRLAVYDGNEIAADSLKQWYPTELRSNGTPIKPGMARLKGDTRGSHHLTIMNPFFSSSRTRMLMPKALAALEFPELIQTSPAS